MPQIDSNRLRLAAVSAVLVLLAGLLLAACGGSSPNSSSSKNAAKAASGAGSRFGARGAALRRCLQKNGITLPERKGSQRGVPGAGGPLGTGGAGASAAPKLPTGVTRAQMQAALKECGGGQFPKGGKAVAARGAQRFAKFAACMRKHGVTLPQPNTTGKGPIFNTKGIDTTSASFKAADAKCVRELAPSGARPGGQGAPGAGGAQPGPPATAPGGGEAGGAAPSE
jgi:hypothetical protein